MTTIKMEAAALAKVLNDVKGLAKRDGSVAHLGNVLVTVGDGALEARTSNFDIEVTRVIPLVDQPSVSFSVDAQRFAGIVSALPAGSQVTIDVGDGSVTVRAARSRFRLGTLKAADFPRLPFTGKAELSITPDMTQALRLARAGTAAEAGAQYWLSGVFIGTREGVTWAAGSDGNRMFAINLGGGEIPEMILSGETIDLLGRFGGDCVMTTDDGKVRFDFGTGTITAKLIDAIYPAFTRVIPDETPTTISFEAEDALAALNRLALVADDKDRTVSLAVDGLMMTLANRSSADQGNEEVACECTGDAVTSAFRLAYLRQALEAVDADTAIWSIGGDMMPTKIINPKRPAVIAVVMPTR